MNKIKYKLLDACKECADFRGITSDNMVRCKINAYTALIPVAPSNYMDGIINNGLDVVRCVKYYPIGVKIDCM
jgi:sulfur relay (sulfurtransferase) complex TusBCD TusD component (DsrE family)